VTGDEGHVGEEVGEEVGDEEVLVV